jgi:hypothetical protein
MGVLRETAGEWLTESPSEDRAWLSSVRGRDGQSAGDGSDDVYCCSGDSGVSAGDSVPGVASASAPGAAS